ncbi:hypothetical protein [Deinococcus sp. Leaf326]|uniref:hypothetical protein n=1 Tax=Deinococcus sp. Leaf326 TaxID=1736338 RepID=UPI0006F31F84|nr:hypothetical protein [Deinococcus sp. Leaf326]KQR23006.1 hypothetical protein ASF71_07585 [Deinococcus sp. Leaf326]
MTQTPLRTESVPFHLPRAEILAQLLAAEAVLACLGARAPLRLETVSLTDAAVHYALEPDLRALQNNRGLLDAVVMTALAQGAAAEILGVRPPISGRDPRALLQAALTEPEELATLDAYLQVLVGRARAALRRAWAEVQVVAAGLCEYGVLDVQAVHHRVACAQGIRGTLLN